MTTFISLFLAAFLPLFVAINIPGILPLYIGMTEAMDRHLRRTLLVRALTAAFILALLMLFAGDIIFKVLGISLNDLRVGGGIILLVIAVSDLAFGDLKKRRGRINGEVREIMQDETDLPIVPLGIPLIIGPGAITTILVMQNAYGYPVTLLSIAVNMLLVFIAFSFGPGILRHLGPSASKAIGKVASLFLAAISVGMIRAGVMGMLQG